MERSPEQTLQEQLNERACYEGQRCEFPEFLDPFCRARGALTLNGLWGEVLRLWEDPKRGLKAKSMEIKCKRLFDLRLLRMQQIISVVLTFAHISSYISYVEVVGRKTQVASAHTVFHDLASGNDG
jgi:hypothetical protein